MPEPTSPAPRRRRRPTLVTLMALVAVVALGLGLWKAGERAGREREASWHRDQEERSSLQRRGEAEERVRAELERAAGRPDAPGPPPPKRED